MFVTTSEKFFSADNFKIRIQGRLGRVNHLALFLFWTVVMVAVALAAAGIYSLMHLNPLVENILGFAIVLPVILYSIISIYAIKVRRLHDMNFSGWWLLPAFIPVVGAFWVLCIFIMSGTPSENRFGAVTPNASKQASYVIYACIALFIGCMILAGMLPDA